jgi:hypothetical protein
VRVVKNVCGRRRRRPQRPIVALSTPHLKTLGFLD